MTAPDTNLCSGGEQHLQAGDPERSGVMCRARDLRPLDVFRVHGFVFECERQARRTTFARAVKGDPMAGARIQLKHSKEVALLVARGVLS